MAKKQGKGSKKDDQPQSVVTDSRFASVHSDPRFKTPNLKNVKVKVDDRFSRKELEKLNAGSSGKKVNIDRYGRKLKGQDSSFDKYFKESSDESGSDEESEEETGDESESDDEKIASGDSESESDDDDESTKVDKKAKKVSFVDRARGEGGESSSDSESDSSSDSEEEVTSEEESDLEVEQGKPEEGDPSDTFAVVNMDWDNLRAVDLMATFISFVPKSGLIKSISIYPSEFGKEQMQKEEVEGPPRELFKKKSKRSQKDDDSDSDSDIDTTNQADLERAARKLYEEEDGEEDYDSKALRRYQLQRLRYYYAVVKCDSVATAKNIYDNCDGTEYESTANIFDLRYVPEGMDFDDSDAKDVCTKIPTNYKPNTIFVTDALQHSKVKLTWDETPKERLAVASRLFSQKEIDDMDFKAYLASDSENEDEEEQTAKDKYKQLLGGKLFDSKTGDDSDDDVDMEITFNPGLSEQEAKAQQEAKEEEENEESTISAYKRKQKERRKQRMDKFKQDQKAQKEQQQPKDKSQTKSSKKHSKHDDKDDKSKAELELLMMNEDGEKEHDHFDMKDIIKSEKKKNKKKAAKNDEINTQDDFDVDLKDPRFQEIFENRDYSIDPTSSDFKKTKAMKKILDERSKRRTNQGDSQPVKKQKTSGNELNSLVDKLKRKHKSK